MKSEPTRMIEILESRIAPARVIIAGIPNTLGVEDTDFSEAPFVNTEDNPLDPISGPDGVGPGFLGEADTFYLRLSKGDKLQLFRTSAGASVEDFITVQSGNIVVFFIDKMDTNGIRDNEVSEAEIVGIAAGNGAKFELKAALAGDIIYNLNDQGTSSLADDTLIMAGAMSPGINIPGFTVGSSVGATILNAGIPERVGGKVIASGKISNVIISGDVGAILAGSAGNAETFNFFPNYIGTGGLIVNTPGGDGVFNFSPGPGKAGSSIQNTIVNSITDRMEAGIGGEGGAGGSIKKAFIRGDSDGFELRAGDGGTTSPAKKNGGKGGAIDNITIAGAVDFTANDLVQLNAGLGGDSTDAGKGGVGGNVSNIFVGYTLLNGKRILSNGILRDNVLITSGGGGEGKVGGKGGLVSTLDILTSTPEGPGDEISVIGGDGGNSVTATGGKAGIGGSILKSAIRNVEASIGADIGIRAGDGGASLGLGIGAAGGAVTSLSLLGRQIQVDAGDGSDGKVGGKGGSLSKLTVELRDGVVSDALVFNAGIGGDGNAGNGGKGGDIATIAVLNSDVNVLEINSGIKGNGGDSVSGRGGAGGKVTGVAILDTDANGTRGGLNVMNIRTGTGGDGDKGGGSGGLLSAFSIVGLNIEPTVVTGNGGLSTLNGKGGAGGGISKLEVAINGSVRKIIGGVPVIASASTFVSTGLGGDGAGANGSGGVGGTVNTVSINTPGFGSIVAGDGGSGFGARAAAGRGGSILFAGVFAGAGEGQMIAGDAGAFGVRPGAGGSVSGSTAKLNGLFAEQDLTILAGNGTAGGAGGSIMNLGYGSTSATLVPTPRGNILIQAGNGSASADGKSVGKGGSIVNVGGSVNSSDGDTFIRAGDGGSAAKKAAPGGSITNLSLQRGGALDVEFTIQAGDGGDAPQGSRGAKGGSVTGVNVVDISTDAIFRHILAGDGGDGLKVGGAGGSVSKINVLAHDIGVRDGQIYGFDTMGGIFAGAGGAGVKEGINGSVTIVNADMIATIAAGRGATPELATKVENIYLNGGNLLKDSTGAFLPGLPGSQQIFEFGGLSLSAVETTAGTSLTGEVQTLDLAPVRALPVGTQFTLAFQGAETVALSKDATGIEIAAALNALTTVQATGPGNTGTVTVTGSDPSFTITFEQTGDQVGLITGEVDPQRTAPLPLAATAAQVEIALDALPFINAAGGVTVTPSLPSGYQIAFNNPANQSQIIGQEFFNVFSTDIQPGIGSTALPVTETTLIAGNEVHAFRPIAPFKFSIGYTEGLATDTTAQLSANATANEVQLALEALPTIDPGDVTVTKRIAPTAPDGTFDVTFSDLVDHPALQITLFANELNVYETAPGIPGATENIARETQIIYVDPMGDGLITFQFGVDSFALDLSAGFTVANLSDELNIRPSIIAQGGVVVVELAPFTYQLTFGKAGDQPEINVQEDSFPLGYAHVLIQGGIAQTERLLFTHEFGAPVRFSYNGQMSVVVAPDPLTLQLDPFDIDAALEALPGIGVGGVTINFAADNSFTIEFTQFGDRLPLNVGQDVTVAGDLQYRGVSTTILPGSATTSERQVIQSADTGFFSLAHAGAVSPFIPAGASVAQVQGAIDFMLAGITPTTSALVTAGVVANAYQVEFLQAGGRAQIFVEGLDIVQAVKETVKGANTLEQREVQVVEFGGFGDFALHLPVAVTAEEFKRGGDFTLGLQVLGLAAVQALSGSQFTLSFQGETTGVLPSGASGQNIEDELNLLTTIQNEGGVSVVTQPNGRFDIEFNTPGDKIDVITGIVEGGISTTLLPGDSTPAQIADALNLLAPIIAVGGVSVEQPNAGSFNVIFNVPGQMPTMEAFFQIREIQELNFYQAGEFTIAFGGDVTASIPAGSTPAQVANALNALPAVQDAGGVTVSNGLNSRYEIQFNNAGDLASFAGSQTIEFENSTLIQGSALVNEIQKVVKTRRFVFDPQKILTGNFVGAFSDASEIDGRKFKWLDANANGIYELNEIPIDGLVAAKVFNQAKVNFTPEARIVGGEFGFVESTKGTATEFEVQLLTIKADKYTLVFNGEQTASISGKASILAIQKALNALASIQATGPSGLNGSVTVTADLAPNTYSVFFNTPGDQAPIIAPFFYDYNNIF